MWYDSGRIADQEYYKACGEELRRARLERGLSREELAECSRVHVNTIGAIERGDHDVNSSTKCWILAAIGCKSLVIRDGVDMIVLHDGPAAFPRSDIQAMPDARIVGIIGQAIRDRREGLGYTLLEAAERAAVHPNTLWNIERGLVSATGLHLHRIFITLGVSIVTPSPENLELE